MEQEQPSLMPRMTCFSGLQDPRIERNHFTGQFLGGGYFVSAIRGDEEVSKGYIRE